MFIKPNNSNTRTLKAINYELILGSRTLVMAIINVTPDSFSDGVETYTSDVAIERAFAAIEAGADIIDIGGESTRPGADPVSQEEELSRVLPVIEAVSSEGRIPVSIDSYKSEVVRQAIDAGACIVNDVSAGNFDPEMANVVARTRAAAMLMHIKGNPRDMQINPEYQDLIGEIRAYLERAVSKFVAAGVPSERIIVDPGIGFGKKLEHNLELIRNISEFKDIAAGVLLGTSRKAFIGRLTGREVKDRLAGTIASVVASSLAGADIVRVHDVKEVVDALKVSDAIKRSVR